MEIVLILGIGLFFFATMIMALLYYDYKIKELSVSKNRNCLDQSNDQDDENNCEYQDCSGCEYCECENEQLELPKEKSKEEKLNDDIKEIDLITKKLQKY